MEDESRLDHQRGFWNEKARENAMFHIVSDPVMWDEKRRDAAFEEMGLQAARRMAPFLGKDVRVLDLGCGIGRVIHAAAPMAAEVTGVDISREMLDQAGEYLAERDNVRLVQTSGAELPGVEDGSIGFLYSVLCLIHVDKRSAWQYFLEIARVLESGGVARLQFHDMLSEEGMDAFIASATTPYPMEFYCEEELRRLLARAGLDVLRLDHYARFMDVLVVNGSARDWMEARRGQVQLDHEPASGVRVDPREGATIATAWSNGSEKPVAFRIDLLTSDQEAPPRLLHEVVVRLPARSQGTLTMTLGADGTCAVTGDAEVLGVWHGEVATALEDGATHLQLRWLPAGFPVTQEEAAHWPGAVRLWPMTDEA